MNLRSITMRSELLTLGGVSHVQWHDGYGVQRTPSEPDYWHGNQLILRSNHRSAADVFALFEAHFPDAAHRSVVWDMPELTIRDLPDFTDLGGTVDGYDALTLQAQIADAPTPDGVVLRAVEGEADWDQLLNLMDEVGIEEGYDAASHRPFIEKRNVNRRALIAQGLGQWFGAFKDGALVAHMGMFHNDQVARYQSVETKKANRKQGLCSALLRHAALWALDRAPKAQVTIVAEADSDAGRLYRRMGFAHGETIYGVERSGY